MYSVLLLTMLSAAEPGSQPQQAVMQAGGCNSARMQTYAVPQMRAGGCSGSSYAISRQTYLRAGVGCSGGVAASAGCSGGAGRGGLFAGHRARVQARHDARAVRRSGGGGSVEAVAVAPAQCSLAVVEQVQPQATVQAPPVVVEQAPPVTVQAASCPPQATIAVVNSVPVRARLIVPRQRVLLGFTGSNCPNGNCPGSGQPIFGWR